MNLEFASCIAVSYDVTKIQTKVSSILLSFTFRVVLEKEGPRNDEEQVFSRSCSSLRNRMETLVTQALIFRSPKPFVYNLPDSGRHVTRPNQGLSIGRRENLGTKLYYNKP